MSKNSLKIEILSSSFTIQSNDDVEYLRSVIRYLEEKISEVQENYPIADPKKILILTALNLVDRILKLERNQTGLENKELEEISKITDELIFRLDSSIGKN